MAASICKEAEALERALIASPGSASSGKGLKDISLRRSLAEDYLRALADLDDAGKDPELIELVDELAAATDEAAIALACCLEEPEDTKKASLLVEIRQGVGGEEAALWVRQLARMFSRYAERRGWNCRPLSVREAKAGGLKECILAISGRGTGILLSEVGVHRVQRVSPTDSRDRVHTSAATVAVLVEPKKEEFVLDLDEVEIQIFHASGNGGQNINKVATAVRVRHLPTGITVSMQDERQQSRNRIKALRVLSARLAARKSQETQIEERDLRRSQLGSGDRSSKMRTYDFPEGLVVDHRRGIKTNRLSDVLNGDLDLLYPRDFGSAA